MSQATHHTPHPTPPRMLPRCFACRQHTHQPIPLATIDKTSGPSHTVVICDGCARAGLAEHRLACDECLAGTDCAAATDAKELIRRTAAVRRAEREAAR
ncbi:hypothetical protein [Streptomyces sp. CNQ085]|uniref:hypothetical protein n=1 Tax=Streptomyces sp. CNQ085 TaxID=2886944 RepID=UPI001F50FDC9|nr:hypothetical protein [Streptomyces sp. CNQ085]